MQKLDPGAAFGPYRIEGYIAGGGMGEVYAATHTVYGSAVALKVLHANLHTDEDWRLRFSEEGLVGQQLKHPNVLSARELVDHDGRVALVLDLVGGGQTLQRVMAREFPDGLPLVQALHVLLGLLQGVEYAHGKGIVHGDIKPENVLIQGDFRDPPSWVPKVTDFGTVGLIAHPVLVDGKPAVVASPRYASPEHLEGVDRLRVESDIYTLGLLLHYLLTGKHASTARTVEEAAETVFQPVPRLHLVDQPDALLALFGRATAVEPQERFSSCREMALAVREVLDALGAGLELEDLQADLATEIMEERAQMRRDAAVHAALAGASDDPQSTDTDLSLETATEAPPPRGAEEAEEGLEDEPDPEDDAHDAAEPVAPEPQEAADAVASTEPQPQAAEPAVDPPAVEEEPVVEEPKDGAEGEAPEDDDKATAAFAPPREVTGSEDGDTADAAPDRDAAPELVEETSQGARSAAKGVPATVWVGLAFVALVVLAAVVMALPR